MIRIHRLGTEIDRQLLGAATDEFASTRPSTTAYGRHRRRLPQAVEVARKVRPFILDTLAPEAARPHHDRRRVRPPHSRELDAGPGLAAVWRIGDRHHRPVRGRRQAVSRPRAGATRRHEIHQGGDRIRERGGIERGGATADRRIGIAAVGEAQSCAPREVGEGRRHRSSSASTPACSARWPITLIVSLPKPMSTTPTMREPDSSVTVSAAFDSLVAGPPVPMMVPELTMFEAPC